MKNNQYLNHKTSVILFCIGYTLICACSLYTLLVEHYNLHILVPLLIWLSIISKGKGKYRFFTMRLASFEVALILATKIYVGFTPSIFWIAVFLLLVVVVLPQKWLKTVINR